MINRRIPERKMQKLIAVLRDIGWTMYFPIVDSTSLPGAIVGTHAFVDVIKETLEAGELDDQIPLPPPISSDE